MNAAENRSGPHRSGGKKAKQTTAAGVVIAVLIGGYTLLRPTINDATGWNLPALPANEVSREQVADRSSTAPVDSPKASSAKPKQSDSVSQSKASADHSQKSKPDDASTKTGRTEPIRKDSPGPLASKMTRGDPASSSKTNSTASRDADAEQSDLKYGLLREISPDRYLSPAGVLYTPGSAEGHRLEHLRRHTKDQPNRSGKHGVFDGDMPGALATIDKAYEKAQANQRTTKEVDGNRTIYTVDMGKRVGYVGGRDGRQRRNPMARRVRLVMEGNRLITAFPL
ncbi:hypothetical protein LOC71_18390 [Rhodopirellula sp. JC740]|uniref:Uncharacterized protein n=1 Tax=Rhodopirellula halodulae TaxID=2894198 RepID=A0ABS8NL40_9BACT|nr:hypothetical protein [Rhodopirellula sp. JC740]MCC9644250.1 hypothetical protein [Rhodopirellula sp. JC740]